MPIVPIEERKRLNDKQAAYPYLAFLLCSEIYKHSTSSSRSSESSVEKGRFLFPDPFFIVPLKCFPSKVKTSCKKTSPGLSKETA